MNRSYTFAQILFTIAAASLYVSADLLADSFATWLLGVIG